MSSRANSTTDALLERLSSEPQRATRRGLLRKYQELWRPETVTLLYDEVVRLARVDLRRAGRLAECADWLSRKLRDDGARAAGLRAAGHIHLLRGRHAAALELYQAALEINRRLGRDLDYARTLSGGGLQALIYLGRYDEAFTWSQRAKEIFSAHGSRLHLARLDTNIGNILARQDRFEEAIAHYRRALDAFAGIGKPEDVAVTLRNMATSQISLNDFREAMATYREAREYCARHEMPQLAAEADYNIAYLYYFRGEYTRALGLYRLARKRCSELGDDYHRGLCDLDQSDICLELNLIEEGAGRARRAREVFKRLGMRYEAAKALANLAIARSRQGDAHVALHLFRKARDWFAREQNVAWTATIDLYRALVCYQQERFEEAQSLCESALAFFSQSPLAGKAALCLLLQARIHLLTGRADSARDACLAALAKLEQAEMPALTYQGLFVMGSIEETLGSTAAARESYRKAHASLENLRSRLPAEEMKIAFLKDKLAVYESLVRLCLESGPSAADAEAAFSYIEQAKSRSLADLIAMRAHAPAEQRSEPGPLARINALREELNWYSRGIQMLESGIATLREQRLRELRAAARDCERRLAEAIGDLRAEDYDFARLEAARTIDLDGIRSSLPANAILLQYYRVRDTFYACILSRESLKFIPAGSATHLRGELNLLRFQLSKLRLGADHVGVFERSLLAAAKAHLREFYRRLIAPIARELKADHIIVAPHEFLHHLPFHALMDGDQYFGDRFSISYAPSASVYSLCAAKGAAASGGSLVLGVPDSAAPHIMDEIRAVASVTHSPEVFAGPAATLDVLRKKGATSRFIHIATHGRFRQDNPMFSSIRLGDRDMSLLDLYELFLPAELVTLSGCGTGLNAVVGADELLGLMRGLFFAGAQSALLTLWDVNDKTTAAFMRLFYERLRQTEDKAKALQSATAEIRSHYEHPFYWAPFLLVGKYL
jgi:tetratricopeptide (TPR) repeat protein